MAFLETLGGRSLGLGPLSVILQIHGTPWSLNCLRSSPWYRLVMGSSCLSRPGITLFMALFMFPIQKSLVQVMVERVYIQLRLKMNIGKILNRVLKSKKKIPEKKNPFNIKKFLFYSLAVSLTTILASKKIGTHLHFRMSNNDFNQVILKKMKIFKDGTFSPTVFLYFGFMQVIFAKYFETRKYIRMDEEKISQVGSIYRLPLHHTLIKEKKVSPPVAVVIAGCEGKNEAMIDLMYKLQLNFFKVVGIEPEDLFDAHKLKQLLKKVKDQNETNNVYAVGLDYGANLLINASVLETELLSGLASIGNPLDLEIAEKNIESSWTAKLFYYDRIVFGLAKNKIPLEDIKEKTKNIKIYDLDRLLNRIPNDLEVKNRKFKNSSINSIEKITTKSLFIQSLEDPLSTSLDDDRIDNENCIYIETGRGGHQEWFESNSVSRWATSVVISYFKSLESVRRDQPHLFA